MGGKSRPYLTYLVGLLSVLTAVLAMVLIPGEVTIFQSQPLQDALVSEGLYAKAPDWLADAASRLGVGSLTGSFNKQDFVKVIKMLIPQSWLEAEGSSILTQVWSYLNFETNQLDLKVSFINLKATFDGEKGIALFRELVDTFPTCTQDQLSGFSGIQNPESSVSRARVPSCKPPEPIYSAYVQYLSNGFSNLYKDLPDQINLSAAINPYRARISAGVEIYRNIHLVLYLAFFLELGLLLFGALLNTHSIKSIFSFLGSILVISGILVMILSIATGIFLNFGSDALLGKIVSTQVQSSEWFQVLKNSLLIVLNRMLILYILSGILYGLGGGAVLYLRRHIREPYPG